MHEIINQSPFFLLKTMFQPSSPFPHHAKHVRVMQIDANMARLVWQLSEQQFDRLNKLAIHHYLCSWPVHVCVSMCARYIMQSNRD